MGHFSKRLYTNFRAFRGRPLVHESFNPVETKFQMYTYSRDTQNFVYAKVSNLAKLQKFVYPKISKSTVIILYEGFDISYIGYTICAM